MKVYIYSINMLHLCAMQKIFYKLKQKNFLFTKICSEIRSYVSFPPRQYLKDSRKYVQYKFSKKKIILRFQKLDIYIYQCIQLFLNHFLYEFFILNLSLKWECFHNFYTNNIFKNFFFRLKAFSNCMKDCFVNKKMLSNFPLTLLQLV